jgi:hypothetical protein
MIDLVTAMYTSKDGSSNSNKTIDHETDQIVGLTAIAQNAMNIIAPGGTFIFYLYGITCPASLSLIAYLSYTFENVHIVKPDSVRCDSSICVCIAGGYLGKRHGDVRTLITKKETSVPKNKNIWNLQWDFKNFNVNEFWISTEWSNDFIVAIRNTFGDISHGRSATKFIKNLDDIMNVINKIGMDYNSGSMFIDMLPKLVINEIKVKMTVEMEKWIDRMKFKIMPSRWCFECDDEIGDFAQIERCRDRLRRSHHDRRGSNMSSDSCGLYRSTSNNSNGSGYKHTKFKSNSQGGHYVSNNSNNNMIVDVNTPSPKPRNIYAATPVSYSYKNRNNSNVPSPQFVHRGLVSKVEDGDFTLVVNKKGRRKH